MVKELNGMAPQVGAHSWIADNATVVGDVRMGERCSIWFQAVLRGDVGEIVLGDEVNIQDGAVLHTTLGQSTVRLGNRVSVGHRAIVHGCMAEDDVLIGMGAVVLDNAVLERGSIVAAGAVILENTRVEAGSIYAGVPAKKVKQMDVEEAVKRVRSIADGYVKYKDWYGDGF